jgi:glycosyltransferase involved in cell wall biosynthesis
MTDPSSAPPDQQGPQGSVSSAAADQAARPELRGHVDLAEAGRIKGWAWDPGSPKRSLVIELCEGERVLARTTASELRQDLKDAGVGTGLYGFTFTLSRQLFPLGRHVVRVRFAEQDLDLAGSPAVLQQQGAKAEFDADQIGELIRQRLAVIEDRAELAAFVTMLASGLDDAFAQRWRVGDPVLAPAAGGPSSALPPANFKEAVERVKARYPEIAIPAARKPVVSIVLASRDAFAEAHACIRAIAASQPATPYEIILVDDGSTDETLIARAVLPQAVRLFRTPNPVGEVKALRAGQALTQGRLVLFLDARARPARGMVDAMAGAFEVDSGVGIVGARLLGGDGKVSALGVGVSAVGELVAIGAGLPPDHPDVAFTREPDAVLSHAMMIEKALWTRAGGFDEEIPDRPHADADLCFKVRRLGRRIVALPTAGAALDLLPETLSPTTGPSERSRFAEGHRRFQLAWRDTLSEPRFASDDLSGHGAGRRALVIDHAFPTPDRDAGSAAIVSHIRALQTLGYDVSFAPGGPPELHETATPALQAMGVRCFYAPYAKGPVDVLERLGSRLDLVYIHRYPNARGYLDDVRRLAPQARVVFSVADLHHLREEREAELLGDDTRKAQSAALRDKELDIIGRVDAVITHSDVEADLIRAALPECNVHVVPWTVSARPVTRPFDERSGVAFIGGFDHAPNLDAARWLVDEIMPLVRREDPSITLSLVGAGLPAGFTEGHEGVRALGWIPDLHEAVLSRVRLTVAPLRFGAGLKGKVLESLASGVPCLMTPNAAEGLPRMTQIQEWTFNGAEAFSRAIIATHEGRGLKAEATDEVRAAICSFVDARSVAHALSRALTAKSPQADHQQQPALQRVRE